MELKSAYKQTELGAIPADWEVKQVGDLKPFITSGSRGWAAFYSDRGAPFIRITNLSRRSLDLDLEDLRLVNLTKDSSEGVRTQLQEQDVLISITADIGIIGYVSSAVPKPAYINQHIALVRFSGLEETPKFIGYFLASERPQKLFRAMTDSGAKAGMSLTTVQKLLIALPPTKAEQQAIAAALSDADALIESLEQLIAKKRQIKRGAMHELLTGKRRLPGFSGKWTERSLQEYLLASPDYGINAPGVPASGNLPTYLRITDIDDDGRLMPEHRVAVHHPLAMDYVLGEGEIVFARTGASVGKTYLYNVSDGELVFAGFLIRARINCAKLRPEFFAAFTKTSRYWNWVRVMSMRSGQPGINGNEFATLSLSVPPAVEEQTVIADVICDMDSEIAALQAKVAKAQQIKQGMMQELLTGKVRLV
jgi:type I restriction enzyme S subunit